MLSWAVFIFAQQLVDILLPGILIVLPISRLLGIFIPLFRISSKISAAVAPFNFSSSTSLFEQGIFKIKIMQVLRDLSEDSNCLKERCAYNIYVHAGGILQRTTWVKSYGSDYTCEQNQKPAVEDCIQKVQPSNFLLRNDDSLHTVSK